MRHIKEYSVFDDIPEEDSTDLEIMINAAHVDGHLPNASEEAIESLDVGTGTQDGYDWTSAQMNYYHNQISIELSIFYKIGVHLLDVRIAAECEGFERLYEYEYPEIDTNDKILVLLDSLFVKAEDLTEEVQQDIIDDA